MGPDAHVVIEGHAHKGLVYSNLVEHATVKGFKFKQNEFNVKTTTLELRRSYFLISKLV